MSAPVTPMVTTGSKYLYGFAGFGLFAAVVYGYASGGNGWGPISLGWKDSVGDHLGYGVLVSLAGCAAFLGGVVTAFRDADAEAGAEVAGTGDEPPAVPVAGPSPWPPIAAFSATALVVGLVANTALFLAGAVGLVLVTVEWLVQAWSERATGDPAANREIRNRLMYPVEIPIGGLLGVLVLVLGLSRVLLATSEAGAVVVAIVLPATLLTVAFILSSRPKISANVVTALLLVFAVGVVTAGIISAAVGEREFHHDEPADAPGDHGDEPADAPAEDHG